MNYLTAKNISLFFGWPFAVVGLVGFIPNPVVSSVGYFEVNTAHNLLHLVVGVIFVAGAMISEEVARRALQTLSIVGIGLAVLGFVAEDGMLFGFIHVNEADKWLHAALAIAIVVAALSVSKARPAQTSQAR